MKRFLKNNIGEIITFCLTIVLLLIIFYLVKLFDYSIIVSDLKTQVYPLLEHVKNNLLAGKTLFYDLSLGIGDNILGILYYYLLSPFNILYFFIKNPNTFFMTTIVLRAAFASLFCYKYLKYQFKEEKKIIFMLFSLLYALSSYYISYNMVVEFLDAYMVFPLVLLGIDKIIKEKKYLLYVLSLMYVIITNYYFAYMICIFSFIYFNYRSIIYCKKNELLKNNLKFIGISALACLTMSFVFLPIALEIGNYSRGFGGLFGGEAFAFTLNLMDVFDQYVIGNFKRVGMINPFGFYLYTSIIVFPLIYFYYLNDEINKKEKICTSVIFLILLVSIGCNYANYMWHGFNIPAGFNGRFTFMFILFILVICTKSLYYLKKFNIKHYVIAFSVIYFGIALYSVVEYPRLIDGILLGGYFLIYLFVVLNSLLFKKCEFKIKHYLIGLLILISTYGLGSLIFGFSSKSFIKLLAIYLCIFLVHMINKEKNLKLKHFLLFFLIIMIPFSVYSISSNIIILGICTLFVLGFLLGYIILLRFIPKYKFLNIVLVGLLVCEILYNGYGYLFRFMYAAEVYSYYNDVVDYINKEDKDLFYRIENNGSTPSINNSILYNYYGLDYFMSTAKKDYIKVFKDLDVRNYNETENSILYDGKYHLLSSLLGVKYYIEHSKLENDLYKKINTIAEYDIYLNENSLSLGYMVNNDLVDLDYSGNGLQYINDIYKRMSNNDKDILDKVEVSIKDGVYSFKNTSSRDFYLLIKMKSYEENPDVFINGEELENTNDTSLYYIKNNYKKYKDIDISLEFVDKTLIDDILGVYVYYYNDDVYKKNIDILKDNQMNVISINNDGIEGKINVEEDGLLFISCLYQEDLDVYVDGVKHDKVKLLDAFIGIELEKGKHNIVIKYKPKILYISIIPSICGLILLVLCLRKKKTKKD